MIIIALLFFFIYAFLGWCCEVCFAALKEGKFINRGFLNGPLCPIYGFGVLAVVFLLQPFKENFFVLFLGSVLITSLIELVAGFVLEKMFHQKWWDYSDKPFNIGGYVCPLFSLMWGVACLVVVDRIHPLIAKVVDFLPEIIAIILLAVIIILFACDLIATVKIILKLNKKLERIDELSAIIKKTSNEIGENLATKTIDLVNKKDAIEDKIDKNKKLFEKDMAIQKETRSEASEHREQGLGDIKQIYRELLEASPFGQKRLLRAFPTLKSTQHKEALEKIKEDKLKNTELVDSIEVESTN